MIELAMSGACGFLLSTLLALLMLPAINRRAHRLERVRLERRLPLSMDEIAAERDQLRAAQAVALRQAEQRVEDADGKARRVLADSGHQLLRIGTLEQRAAADAASLAEREAALAEVRAALAGSEDALAASHITHQEAMSREASVRQEKDAVTEVLSRREAALAESQTRIGSLEDRLAAAESRLAAAAISPPTASVEELPAPPSERPALPAPAEPSALPASIADQPAEPRDQIQLRAALTRLKDEQSLMRRDLSGAADERDRLRLRVDQLLLQIEEMQETLEEARDKAQQDLRHAARQDKTLASLKGRVIDRDEQVAAINRQLDDERRRHAELRAAHDAALIGPGGEDAPVDEAGLRDAVARISANLVRFATGNTSGP